MKDCLFCKIANGELHSQKIYEDEYVVCFQDIDPKAPVHVLLIPKRHIESVDTVEESDSELLAKMMLLIPHIAKKLGLENGYRVVSNVGEDGLQSVQHLHFHILGKRKMTWPPG